MPHHNWLSYVLKWRSAVQYSAQRKAAAQYNENNNRVDIFCTVHISRTQFIQTNDGNWVAVK